MKDTDFIQAGVRVLVFDALMWGKVGDKGDNSQFYKPAKILRRYKYQSRFSSWCGGEEVVDVEFEHRKGVSKAHFLTGIKPLPQQTRA